MRAHICRSLIQQHRSQADPTDHNAEAFRQGEQHRTTHVSNMVTGFKQALSVTMSETGFPMHFPKRQVLMAKQILAINQHGTDRTSFGCQEGAVFTSRLAESLCQGAPPKPEQRRHSNRT